MDWPYNETPDGIQTRMAQRMGDAVSVQEGTFGDLMTRAVAYELWRFYEQMRKMLPIAFVDETSGIYLEMRCAEYGITRKQAGFAQTVLTFTGKAGTVLEAGIAAMTASGLTFETTARAEIAESGSVDVPAQAAQAGAAYNVPAGRIDRLLTAIQGVTSVSNLDTAAGGYDAETDEALYARLDELRRSRATSGNAAQYEQWALAVDGVGAARAIELWDGPDTVQVVLAGSHAEPVDERVCEAVAAYIEERRPVGAIVTVVSAEGVTLDIAAQVVLAKGADLETVKASFEQALRDYIQGLAWRSAQVVYARVLWLLLGVEGVEDYTALTLNGGTDNLVLDETQVPVVGEVQLTNAS